MAGTLPMSISTVPLFGTQSCHALCDACSDILSGRSRVDLHGLQPDQTILAILMRSITTLAGGSTS